jgi:hypothetical protein
MALKPEVDIANYFSYGMSKKVRFVVEYGNLDNHCFVKSHSRHIQKFLFSLTIFQVFTLCTTENIVVKRIEYRFGKKLDRRYRIDSFGTG